MFHCLSRMVSLLSWFLIAAKKNRIYHSHSVDLPERVFSVACCTVWGCDLVGVVMEEVVIPVGRKNVV
jgi:hypothetical protein